MFCSVRSGPRAPQARAMVFAQGCFGPMFLQRKLSRPASIANSMSQRGAKSPRKRRKWCFYTLTWTGIGQRLTRRFVHISLIFAFSSASSARIRRNSDCVSYPPCQIGEHQTVRADTKQSFSQSNGSVFVTFLMATSMYCFSAQR